MPSYDGSNGLLSVMPVPWIDPGMVAGIQLFLATPYPSSARGWGGADVDRRKPRHDSDKRLAQA